MSLTPSVTNVTRNNLSTGLTGALRTTLNTTHEHPEGSNRVYCFLGNVSSVDTSHRSGSTTATYAGMPMKLLDEATTSTHVDGGTTGFGYVAAFYLDDPPTGENTGTVLANDFEISVFWVSVSNAGRHRLPRVQPSSSATASQTVMSVEDDLVLNFVKTRLNTTGEPTGTGTATFDDVNGQGKRSRFAHQVAAAGSGTEVSCTWTASTGRIMSLAFAVSSEVEEARGPLKMEHVGAQSMEGAGTQSFTVSGFGVPQMAIIYAHEGNGDALNEEDAKIIGMGFLVGSNQFSSVDSSWHDKDITTDSTAPRSGSSDLFAVIAAYANEGTRLGRARIVQDGIEITFNSNPIRLYVQVVLISGIVAARISTGFMKPYDGDFLDFDTPGMQPNAWFVLAGYSAVLLHTPSHSQSSLGYGLVVKNQEGILKQAVARVVEWAAYSSQTRFRLHIDNREVCYHTSANSLSGGSIQGRLSLHEDGYRLTTTEDNIITTTFWSNRNCYALAIEFENAPELYRGKVPVTGNWLIPAQRAPKALLGHIFAAQDYNTEYADNVNFSMGYGHYFATEEWQWGIAGRGSLQTVTTDTSTIAGNSLLLQGNTRDLLVKGDNPQFTEDGILFEEDDLLNETFERVFFGLVLFDNTSLVDFKKLTLRSEKGSPLSNEEIDSNFEYLFNEKLQFTLQYSNVTFTPVLPVMQCNIINLAQDISINAPLGTVNGNHKFLFRIRDNGIACNIMWDEAYLGDFPEITVPNKLMYVGVEFIDNDWQLAFTAFET
jgi:hypothetical protein